MCMPQKLYPTCNKIWNNLELVKSYQAPLSLGFSREQHWRGLPFSSPMRESEVTQSCPTLSDPMDCSLPGSSVHGIFQEWGAFAFSDEIS